MCVLHLQSLPRTFVYALSSRPLPYRVTYRRPAQRVEAKYQRGTKYYPGRVVVVNGDGTLLNIQYADGDQEIEVPRALVQPLEGYAGGGGGGGGGGVGGRPQPIAVEKFIPPKNLGARCSLSVLKKDSKYNTELVSQIEGMEVNYSGFRPVRGDGNCFYRAVGFSFVEGAIRDVCWRARQQEQGSGEGRGGEGGKGGEGGEARLQRFVDLVERRDLSTHGEEVEQAKK